MRNIKAVILAGGKGTRLFPITYEIPKPLLPVKKKPIINYLVDLFLGQGIGEVAVLINQNFQEEFFWWKKRYYPEEKILIYKEEQPLGTFGGLYYLKDWLSRKPFFLTNGDELKKIDLSKMTEFHQKKSVLATIALVEVPNPKDYGVVVCKNGLAEQFLEKPKKPPTNYISAGLYLFSPQIFKYHPGPKFSMVETDLFPKLVQKKQLAGFEFEGEWMDCGTFERYEKAIKNWQ
jgi:NDP-sugar pyrophosphorylase family protein